MSKKLNLTLKVWRQKNADSAGKIETYAAKDIPEEASFLEMLDIVNEELVNTGDEPQKAGVGPAELPALLALCHDELRLEIAGLMCIPPHDEEPAVHFALLAKLAREHGLAALSMGMSADFETAIAFGATHVRVGSAIFGDRS